MPPLAHPEALIAEPPGHQRHRSDSVGLTCSSGSSSFLGRLWLSSRRKFPPPFKSNSFGAPAEICGLSKISEFAASDSSWAGNESTLNWTNSDRLHCNEESVFKDLDDRKLKEQLELEASADQEKGLHCKQSSAWANRDDGKNVECCRELPSWAGGGKTEECVSEDSTGFSTEKKEPGVRKIMESLKEVVIGKKQKTRNGSEANIVGHGKMETCTSCEASNGASGSDRKGNEKEGADQRVMKRIASYKAGDVSNMGSVKKMRMSTLAELQRVAGMLQWGNSLEERWLAADELRRLCKDDAIARATLGVQLGAVPGLISLLHSAGQKHQCTALLALLNLAVGNDVNKGAIVQIGAIPRMVKLLQSVHAEVQTATVALFLSLSAIDGNKAVIGASGSLTGLVYLLRSQHPAKKDALRTIYNLSILPDNGRFIVEAGGVPILVAMASDLETAEKSLGTLSNLVQTDVGRHEFAEHKQALYAALIDAMRLSQQPKCQERAVYVVMMMMMHHSVAHQREAMAAAGIIPALVELSLLGSPLAQKRARRTMDSFRRGKAFSAPQLRERMPEGVDTLDAEKRSIARTMSEREVVEDLVRQSLRRTMQRISRRANMSSVVGDDLSHAEATLWSFHGRAQEQRMRMPISPRFSY